MAKGHIRVSVWEDSQLLYVRIPKSGNTSIRRSIDNATNDRMSSAQILKLSEDWTTFSFVRNPWSRLVSTYIEKATAHNKSPRMVNGVYQGFSDYKIPVHANMKFEEFCEVVCDFPDKKTDKHLRSQSSFIMRKGAPIVSFIGKVESMEDDWESLMDLVGLDFKLARLNPSSHEHYSRYFTDKSLIKLVGDRYVDDVRHFNYDF